MVNFTMLAYRRPRLTKQALDSLGGTEGVNCVVRDQYSDSEAWDVVEQWSEKNSIPTRIAYHATRRAGTGAARNDVIEVSQTAFGRGEYLYLSDNDVFFLPGWLDTLIDCYEAAWSSGCRVLGAIGHPYHQQGDTLGICSFNVYHEVKEVIAQPLQSMLMRWEVWDKYGPFKETEEGKVCQGEDVDFGNAIRADGGRLGVVSPPLLVNCGITNSFGEKIPGWELVKAQAPAGVIVE